MSSNDSQHMTSLVSSKKEADETAIGEGEDQGEESCALTDTSTRSASLTASKACTSTSSSSHGESIKMSILKHIISPGSTIGVEPPGYDSDGTESSEGERHVKLPADVFSLLYHSPPVSCSFLLAVVVFAIQITILLLILADMLDGLRLDTNNIDMPSGVSSAVRASQFFAILIAVATQDDLIAAINTLTQGYSDDDSAKVQSDRRRDSSNEEEYSSPWWRSCRRKGGTLSQWVLSIVFRGGEGLLCLGVTFVVIMQSDEVTGMFVDFLAVTFVSCLDDIAFNLSYQGFFGHTVRREARAASRVRMLHKRGPRWVRPLLFVTISSLMIAGWGTIWFNSSNGKFLSCGALYVQFGDLYISDLGFYSGLFRFDGMDGSGRPVYLSTGVLTTDSRPQFAYCADLKAWTFSVATKEDSSANPCDWLLKTRETEQYDLMDISTSEWILPYFDNGGKDDRGVPPHYFSIRCGGCEESNQGSCGETGGACVYGECVCREGWYGVNCQFSYACEEIEVETEMAILGVTEEWLGVYHIMRDREDNTTVTLHERPIYTQEGAQTGDHHVILFSGRRWIMFTSSQIMSTAEPIGKYLVNSFTVNWLSVVPALISSPVDVMTPSDRPDPLHLQWFRPEAYGSAMTQKHLSSNLVPTSASARCTVCDRELNPCQNNGTCDENGQCLCQHQTYGGLCQIASVYLCQQAILSIDRTLYDEGRTSTFDPYSGVYDVSGNMTDGYRPVYIGRQEQGAFSFCYRQNFWALVESDVKDPCSEWLAKSAKSFAYEVSSSEGWLFSGTMPMQLMLAPFYITCDLSDVGES